MAKCRCYHSNKRHVSVYSFSRIIFVVISFVFILQFRIPEVYGVQLLTINITNNGFEPNLVTVQKGETVTWLNTTSSIQNLISAPTALQETEEPGRSHIYLPLVLSDDTNAITANATQFLYHPLGDNINIMLAPGEQFSYTFITVGAHDFFLGTPSRFTGRVIVQDVNTPTMTPTGPTTATPTGTLTAITATPTNTPSPTNTPTPSPTDTPTNTPPPPPTNTPPPPQFADLVTTCNEIDWNGVSLGIVHAGDPFQYTACFANAGNAATGDFVIRFWQDGVQSLDLNVSSYSPGQQNSASDQFPNGLPEGHYRFDVCLDADNQVQEWNENNNCTWYGLDIWPPFAADTK